MEFDNHDGRIRYISLFLERGLEDLPQKELPKGYRFTWYREGDRDHWIDIERSAKELESDEEGRRVWEQYYGGHEGSLQDRMIFVETLSGEKVATATAYYDPFREDPPEIGYLHWVAVKREHQGKGLSKPLVLKALHRLKELGYPCVKIHTQTTTWLACKVYLDLGCRPTRESLETAKDGWRIVKALTDHPALEGLSPASLGEILGSGG